MSLRCIWCISHQLIETLSLSLKLDAMSSYGSDRALLAPDSEPTSFGSFGFLENLEHLLLASNFFPRTQDEKGDTANAAMAEWQRGHSFVQNNKTEHNTIWISFHVSCFFLMFKCLQTYPPALSCRTLFRTPYLRGVSLQGWEVPCEVINIPGLTSTRKHLWRLFHKLRYGIHRVGVLPLISHQWRDQNHPSRW